MPNVSFYILSEQSTRTTEQLVCQLCVKATGQAQVQLVLSESDLKRFDDLLWSYEDVSFLTHGIDETTSKVNLTAQHTIAEDTPFSGIVINQQDTAVLSHQAQRIIEIIAADDTSKVTGRQRYQAYKEAGYTIETFNV